MMPTKRSIIDEPPSEVLQAGDFATFFARWSAWISADLPQRELRFRPVDGDTLEASQGVVRACAARLPNAKPSNVGGSATYDVRVGAEVVGVLEATPPLGDTASLLVLGLVWQRHQREQQIATLQARWQREVVYQRDEIRSERNLRSLTGNSPAMKHVRQLIQQVAVTDSTVLILGETGTGKELVARAIHQLSPRHEQQLVSVNCAALATSVINSELFGHEAGAFTGAAKTRIGRFELAQNGSLFLDEIAELSAETQVLLLRVLQERSIERVGGSTTIPLDVRVMAATHQPLEEQIRQGKFRSDLYFRLNVFPIHVPPLRDRRQDIADLVRHFIGVFNRRMHRQVADIDADSLVRLEGYDWPGNVRELENLVERAFIVAAGDTLRIDPLWLKNTNAPVASQSLADQDRHAILRALDQCNGKIYGPTGAAKLLGLKPTTLYGKMRKLNIPRHDESVE